MNPELQQAVPYAKLISTLLHPFAEVVIHDIDSNSIQAIFNAFSKRVVGDCSFLEKEAFFKATEDLGDIIGPYEKRNYDGRLLKSISLVLKNKEGEAFGFLCINMDVSDFKIHQDRLQDFIHCVPLENTKTKSPLFKDDLFEQMNAFVHQYCIDNQTSLAALNRNDKQKLVNTLAERGGLEGKNAASYVARILGVSRATIYNYLAKRK